MASLGIFLLSFGFLETVHRTSGVHIEPINGDVEVNENEAATLPCKYRVDRDMNPRLEWKKKRNNHISFVYFDGSLVDKYKDRATMSGSSIILHRVTREDSATYRCEVMAKQDPVIFSEISFNLIVLVPPAVPICIVPSSAMSGSTVELVCKESEGSPPSEYTWYKDNRPLLEAPGRDPTANNVSYTVNRKTGLLTFNPVRKTNSGSYFCKAHNKVGQSQGCSVKFMQIKRRLAKSNGANRTNVPPASEDFKHTKSFII
ncbi:junctional adhesion molecule B-like isoform X2 [Narcine bancroftii]|uniref:junctional adhesion molecule B-like isoform X2 n=1 Tax=Narcine bancroftii TaxID=1343680 RepID=UPI00383208A9